MQTAESTARGTALIAMSGGVDSSVAAWLMQQQGYRCIGATMRLYDNEMCGLSRRHTCCSLEDVEDARSVARRLGIPYYVFNFSDDFEDRVIRKFVRSYEQGETPNPCIDCNRYMKFDRLLRRAEELGCDCLVTGHYAAVRRDPDTGRFLLCRAADRAKDQTYFLYNLTQFQLEHIRFPLGSLTKPETRAIAEAQGFANARKHDSQDICFVPDGDYGAFLERYTGKVYPPGPFLDESGKPVGTHRGTVRYTLGQRKGLGLAMGTPVYVIARDPDANTVTIGPESALYRRVLIADDANWISIPALKGPLRAEAKVRYSQKSQPGTAYPEGEASFRFVFDAPQRAVTPGQAVVLYDGDLVVGGGTIRAVPPEAAEGSGVSGT